MAPNISIEVLESLVYSRKHEEAAQYLQTLLRQIGLGAEFGSPETDAEGQRKIYTRLAAAITALIADPSFSVSTDGFAALASHHGTVDSIFQASVFRNSDHLLRQFGALSTPERTTLSFEAQHLPKLLLSYSLNSELDFPFERIFDAAPGLAVPFLLGLLGEFVVLSEAAHQRREALLELGPLLQRGNLDWRLLDNAASAFMHCSYASSPRKHEIKRALTSMFRRFIESLTPLPQMRRPRTLKQRPKMVVPLEWFDSTHAMYRCFASSIARLRERFHLVGLGRTRAVDATSKSLFDEFIDLGGSALAIENTVRSVAALEPDVIYFPSVGMDTYCVALASLRLAPVQMFSLGHPATTNSEAMDYVLSPEVGASNPACFSETMVLVSGYPSMVLRVDADFPSHETRHRPDTLRIAVSAMGAKISVPFLRTCRNIASRVSQPVEFHFLTGLKGVYWFQAREIITTWLPGAAVHRGMRYKEYLDCMNACDLQLSTFPFGGTNTNVDSMKLGIPMVTLEGAEPHARSDAGMMRIVGLPQWLIAGSVAEYEEAALRLISEHDTRCAIATQLQSTNIAAAFMGSTGDAYTEDLSDAAWWLYTMHDHIQGSGKRHWTVEERKQHPGMVA
jgi:hypothetical protein